MCLFFQTDAAIGSGNCMQLPFRVPTNVCDKRVPRTGISSYIIIFIYRRELPQIMALQGNFYAASALGKQKNPALRVANRAHHNKYIHIHLTQMNVNVLD